MIKHLQFFFQLSYKVCYLHAFSGIKFHRNQGVKIVMFKVYCKALREIERYNSLAFNCPK